MKKSKNTQHQGSFLSHRPGWLHNHVCMAVGWWWIMSGGMLLTSPVSDSSFHVTPAPPPGMVSSMQWVFLPQGVSSGNCTSTTDCCLDVICYGLEYTPGASGEVTTYTTGFFADCQGGVTPVISNGSCVMTDHSEEINGCIQADSVLFNSSAYDGALTVTVGTPVILHQVCFSISTGDMIAVHEDPVTDLSVSMDLAGGGHITEFPAYAPTILTKPLPVDPPDGGEMVACTADINVNMVVPPVVMDFCGNILTPAGPSAPVYNPAMWVCEGTVTYTWTYTDCDGNITTWDYVYTVDQTLPPAESGGPVPIAVVIECGLDAMPPAMLPVVMDQCGNILPPPVPVQGGSWSGGCSGTVTYTYTYAGCGGMNFVWIYTYTVECFPLTLRVWLEGPYDPAGDSMRSELNYHHLLPGQDKLLSPSPSVQLGASFTPFGQPYAGIPWNYNGNTGMNFGDPGAPGAPMGVMPYPADVVDWILVTVRENGILPADNIWTCAGWVHTDGVVSFPETCTALLPDPMDDYYIVLQHRNHLGVLSPDPVDMLCGGAILEWDFTMSNSYEPPFRNGQKEVETGVWAMHAANGEQVLSIAGINSQDRTLWRALQNIIGYTPGDYNLDVTANSQDETIWKFNQNRTSGVDFY